MSIDNLAYMVSTPGFISFMIERIKAEEGWSKSAVCKIAHSLRDQPLFYDSEEFAILIEEMI